MKLEDQVCSRDQAKRFVELGIIQGSSAFFFDGHTLRFNSHTETGHYFNAVFCLSAFTVAELGEMLPCDSGIIGWEVHYNDHLGVWNCAIMDLVKWEGGGTIPPTAYESEEETMAQAMADTLIHCLENNLITPEEVNNRLSN